MANALAMVQAIANRFAEAGQAILEIQTARNWTALASGKYTHLLNQIGKLVGATRPFGALDGQYVQYVKAQISANKSSGLIEDIYGIAELIVPVGLELQITEYYPAAFILRLTDPLGLLGPNGAGWTEPFLSAPGADGSGYTPPYGSGNSGSHTVDALAYFIKKAKPAAVWWTVDYELRADSEIFTLDIGPGLDVGHWRGWQGP